MTEPSREALERALAMMPPAHRRGDGGMPPPGGPWLDPRPLPVHYAGTTIVASGPWLLRVADAPRGVIRGPR